MKGLRYTLLGDGPSDRLLDFPIKWALHREGVLIDQAQWADLTSLRKNDGKLIDGDDDLVLAEEARAWKYGRMWLVTQGAPHPDEFKEHVAASFRIYRQRLGCDERKIDQMLADVFDPKRLPAAPLFRGIRSC